MSTQPPLGDAELHELRRWNTPTIYNGWEQIAAAGRDISREAVNAEPITDFMPQMGAMIGWAVTVTVQPGEPRHRTSNPRAWDAYREYVASVPGPKIVVVQDLDKPACCGAFWGEVNSNTHRSLGCVGTITDGGIRDIDEMTYAGFKALARRLCVGHGYVTPVAWGIDVNVFGTPISPGQLIHADKHGFIAIPKGEEKQLLDAARFMDSNECKTVIAAARAAGVSTAERLKLLSDAGALFSNATAEKFGKKGEW